MDLWYLYCDVLHGIKKRKKEATSKRTLLCSVPEREVSERCDDRYNRLQLRAVWIHLSQRSRPVEKTWWRWWTGGLTNATDALWSWVRWLSLTFQHCGTAVWGRQMTHPLRPASWRRPGRWSWGCSGQRSTWGSAWRPCCTLPPACLPCFPAGTAAVSPLVKLR